MYKIQVNEDWLYHISNPTEWRNAVDELQLNRSGTIKNFEDVEGKYHGPGIYIVTNFMYSKYRHGVAIDFVSQDKIRRLIELLNRGLRNG